jgi:hypothetical protein
LGVIASSPTDLQPVLNVVAENAVRVCGADFASLLAVFHAFLKSPMVKIIEGPVETADSGSDEREEFFKHPNFLG